MIYDETKFFVDVSEDDERRVKALMVKQHKEGGHVAAATLTTAAARAIYGYSTMPIPLNCPMCIRRSQRNDRAYDRAMAHEVRMDKERAADEAFDRLAEVYL